MTKTSAPIVFFGSGPVAAESLRLLAQDFTVTAVVTKPRAPHHKGSVPVLSLAEELQLPTHTVTNKKDLDILIDSKPFDVTLAVLIDFGIIVSQKVIDYFPVGIINSHFSILPEWRGADPITFSILSGQKSTGVSLMLLTAGMDEGPLLAYGEELLDNTVTTPELTERLIRLSHGLIQDQLPNYMADAAGTTGPVTMPQDITGRRISYSRKLTKEDGILDWSKPAAVLEREIRAFIEWPKSKATVGGLDIIITQAHVTDVAGAIGTITVIDKKPAFFCREQALIIDTLKPSGKKEMTGEAFLAGYKHLL